MQGRSVVRGWLDRQGESVLGVCHFLPGPGRERLQCHCRLPSVLQLRASVEGGLKPLLLWVGVGNPSGSSAPWGETEAAWPSVGAAGHGASPVWNSCNLCISLLWQVGESMWVGCQRHQPGGVWVPSLTLPSKAPAGRCVVGRPCARLA